MSRSYTLSIHEASVDDACDDAFAVFGHLESDAERLVGIVALELYEAHALEAVVREARVRLVEAATALALALVLLVGAVVAVAVAVADAVAVAVAAAVQLSYGARVRARLLESGRRGRGRRRRNVAARAVARGGRGGAEAGRLRAHVRRQRRRGVRRRGLLELLVRLVRAVRRRAGSGGPLLRARAQRLRLRLFAFAVLPVAVHVEARLHHHCRHTQRLVVVDEQTGHITSREQMLRNESQFNATSFHLESGDTTSDQVGTRARLQLGYCEWNLAEKWPQIRNDHTIVRGG